jgi:hypothetical protein
VTEAVVPPAGDLEALVEQERLEDLAHAAVERPEHRLAVLPEVGQDQGVHLGHEAAHVSDAAHLEVEAAEPHHLQALADAAQRVGVVDLDVDLAPGGVGDELLELLGAAAEGVVLRHRR